MYNHDAEDPDGIVSLGQTEDGEEVEINRRAVESDLVIYVNINLVTMDGGHKSVPVGLGTYKTVRHHHNVRTMMTSRSYMDPSTSSFHRSCDRMGAVTAEHVKIFTIETTLNSDTFSHALGFLQKREGRWNTFDRLNFRANSTALSLMPVTGDKLKQAHHSPYISFRNQGHLATAPGPIGSGTRAADGGTCT